MSNENRNCSSCNNMMKQNVTDNCQDVNQLTALNNPMGFKMLSFCYSRACFIFRYSS